MTNYLRKILITGGGGQLAHALSSHARAREYQLIPCIKDDLDITNDLSIVNAITKYTPDIIINTAAYTNVDKAEQDSATAMLINHLGTEKLAKACAKHKIPLIHLSTDYIFNGTSTTPYQENDSAHPINVYGQSKWLGEQAVRKYCEAHIILRVSGIFSEHGHNFFNTMVRLQKNNTPLRVVADQITCPTYAGDIADTLLNIAKKMESFGTYHYCSAPPTNWHAFAEAILNQSIQAISTAEYPTPAKRPAYSVLDCSKIKADYDITQPSWQSALEKLQ